MERLTPQELELLNSKVGLKYLIREDEIDVDRALEKSKAEVELRILQERLILVHDWVIQQKRQVIVVCEGRDGAGKSGIIRRISAHINPRHFRTVALPKPTEDEVRQWYFQRYVSVLPKPGELAFFDRSWYNRAVLEPVNDFCTEQEYQQFMGQVNEFERMLVESGVHLIKLYFSITKEEQARRFDLLKRHPLKKWTVTSLDFKAQKHWDEYTEYKERMLERTHTDHAPWWIIDSNTRGDAANEALSRILTELEIAMYRSGSH
ncbi:MAG: polyphosphate kinase 2 [Flavobacteriales bacterium]|nr:polyphosphate kinase 2 [Flavobacteriales bacterium]